MLMYADMQAKTTCSSGNRLRRYGQKDKLMRRCSVYSLYWYKSTNTDAEGAESTHYALNYALLMSLASVALLVQKYKYGR